MFFVRSSAESVHRDSLWGVYGILLCYSVEYMETSVGRALHTFHFFGEGKARAAAGAGLEWVWLLSAPRFLSNAVVLWPKNKRKPKCCTVISTWTWENTKTFLYLSACHLFLPLHWNFATREEEKPLAQYIQISF